MSRRGRPCEACRHPRRADLDAALAEGLPLRKAAELYHLSKSALERHRVAHVIPNASRPDPATTPAETPAAPSPLYSNDVAKQARLLQLKSLRLLAEAEEAGTPRVALSALRTIRENLETLARLQATDPPQWDAERDALVSLLRDRILGALEPHPAAREAVANAFRETAG